MSDRRRRLKGRKSGQSERFAMIPVSILVHPAFKTLPVGFQRVLWLLAAQYEGNNNGNLSLTRKQARHFGLNNERHRTQGLKELERRGLIEKTRPGGIASGGKLPTLWALAWRQIEFTNGKEREVVKLPPKTYMEWNEQKNHDTYPASGKARIPLADIAGIDTHPDSGGG